MSMEEHISQLTAQVAALWAQLTHHSWSHNVLFILLYMKGGTAGPWATQKINSILYLADAEEVTWAGFVSELNEMFADPNHQATAQRKLATLCQGDGLVEELIQEFKIHGPISGHRPH